MLKHIKTWWLYNIHNVGKKAYWENRVDPWFTGEYIITTKRDKNGYIGIYNKKVGHRVVPYRYIEVFEKNKERVSV